MPDLMFAEFDLDSLLGRQWPNWQKNCVEYLSRHGIPSGSDYGLGYHEGAPTVYWGDRICCVWDDPNNLDSVIDEIKKTLSLV